jgi:hypothetical protein
MAPESPEEEESVKLSALKASIEEVTLIDATGSPAAAATQEKSKKKGKKKPKNKVCQTRHRVKFNPLKTETDIRSLWKSNNHTKEQACEVLAKLVDCRHITGKDFGNSGLVHDIMVFLKERAERGGSA